MATTYWVTGAGEYYSSTTGAKNASDSQLQAVSVNGASVITTVPTKREMVEAATRQIAISDHSIWGSQVKMH